jgi:hypothetical protein
MFFLKKSSVQISLQGVWTKYSTHPLMQTTVRSGKLWTGTWQEQNVEILSNEIKNQDLPSD